MLEATFLLKMISWVTGFLNVHYFQTGNIPAQYSSQCRVGFTGWTVEALSLFKRSGLDMFPSAPIFMISAAASYVFNTLQYQAKELQALGPAFATKYYFSLITLAALVIVVSLFRAKYNCDTGPVVIFSILFGLIVGSFLVFQNNRIFGENGPYAINLLGIPILKNRTATGQKLYICPTTASA
jgi:glucan phosphoethanolaminetransferase (alkaline phosphatase superfamily)